MSRTINLGIRKRKFKWIGHTLTLNLLTTTIVGPPSNASKWQMGFNSAFKGLNTDRLRVLLDKSERPEGDHLRHDMACSLLRLKEIETISKLQMI